MNTEYIEDGYIKLSRRVFSSKTFSSLNAIQKLITIYLILMANHQDNEWWDKYHKKFIIIKRGSFITSIEKIRKKMNDKLVTTKKIRTVIKLLNNMEFLIIGETDQEVRLKSPEKKGENGQGKRQGQYTHITILKYSLYQNGDSYKGKQKGKARARQGQGKGKARAINKNGKKGNNGKNGKKEYIETVFLTEFEYKKLIKELGEPLTKEMIKDLSLYIQSKGKKYKSHYATILAWHRKNVKEGKGDKILEEGNDIKEKKIVKKLTDKQIEANKQRISKLVKRFKNKILK